MSEPIDSPLWATESFRAFIERRIPFNALLGLKVTRLDRGFAVMEVPFRPELIGDIFRPAIHGGVLSTLIDATGGAAAFTMVDVVDRVSTVDMRVDYLRPGVEDTVIAEAEIVRMGNRVCAVQVRVHQGDPVQPIALGSVVYNVSRNVGAPVDRRGQVKDG
jgi:uncharacterized protein (TIGR00369 family)